MGRMTLRNLNPVRSFSVKLKFEPPGPCMAAADHGETIAERNADCCHSFPGGMAQLVCRTGLGTAFLFSHNNQNLAWGMNGSSRKIGSSFGPLPAGTADCSLHVKSGHRYKLRIE